MPREWNSGAFRFAFYTSLSMFNTCICQQCLNLALSSSKCGPRLSPGAAEKLKNRYVLMRNGAGEYERETGKKITIPITVR